MFVRLLGRFDPDQSDFGHLVTAHIKHYADMS